MSAGRRYIGMEHWLPLYYESLETVFDYLPEAAVTLDHQADDVRARPPREQIADFYAARQRGRRRAAPGRRSIARCGPSSSISTTAEWERGAGAAPRRRRSRPSPLAAGTAQCLGRGARPGRDFAEARADPRRPICSTPCATTSAPSSDAGRRVLIAAYSAGSAERLKTVLREHGVDRAPRCRAWADFAAIAAGERRRSPCSAIEHGYRFDDAAIVTEQDILGDRLARPPRRRANLDQDSSPRSRR